MWTPQVRIQRRTLSALTPTAAATVANDAPPASGTAVIRLRRLPLDRASTSSIAAAILLRAWAGFSP